MRDARRHGRCVAIHSGVALHSTARSRRNDQQVVGMLPSFTRTAPFTSGGTFVPQRSQYMTSTPFTAFLSLTFH
jgi:hypothetical protein